MKIRIEFEKEDTTEQFAKRIVQMVERMGGNVKTDRENNEKPTHKQRDVSERVGEVWEG